MQKSIFTFLLSLVIFFLPELSLAEATQYVCTVKKELHLEDNGELTSYKKPLEIGSIFAVDRVTGAIVGSPLKNTTAKKIELVTQGDEKRNFGVFSPSVDGYGKADTGLLIIKEWKKGKVKPFVALDGNVYSGVCE